MGKFVIFYNAEFVDAYDSMNNAGIAAVEKFGNGPYLIRQVGAPTSMPMPASVAYHPVNANF